MKTQRVRIAVCVASNGEWSSAGWSGRSDSALAEHAGEYMPANSSVHFIEADVPLPTTIAAETASCSMGPKDEERDDIFRALMAMASSAEALDGLTAEEAVKRVAYIVRDRKGEP